MTAPVKRRYSSPARDRQQAATRARITDAAADLFATKGYGLTTIRDIAEHAEVAPDTVYATFGSKARVLTAVIDARLGGGGPGAPRSVLDRPEAQAVKNERDQRRQLELFAADMAALSTRVRPVYEIMRTAAAVEPEMAAVFAEMDGYRLRNMRQVAEWLAANGPLKTTTERAADIIWTLASPDIGRMLCDRQGWTEAEHAQWLAHTLAAVLLEAV